VVGLERCYECDELASLFNLYVFVYLCAILTNYWLYFVLFILVLLSWWAWV